MRLARANTVRSRNASASDECGLSRTAMRRVAGVGTFNLNKGKNATVGGAIASYPVSTVNTRRRAMLPADAPTIEITYVGGPTAVLSVAGVRFVIDPTLDAAGGEYASGTVTLRKTTGPALSAQQLGRLDVALLSHDQHADNLDHAGRALLRDVPLVLTTPAAAQRLGNGAVGLAPWETKTMRSPAGPGLRVTATPARHGPVGVEK